jgi:hypothetical protein
MKIIPYKYHVKPDSRLKEFSLIAIMQFEQRCNYVTLIHAKEILESTNGKVWTSYTHLFH